MQTFPLNVPINGQQEFRVSAAYIYYEKVDDGVAYPQIRIRAAGVDQTLRPGQGLEFDHEQADFRIFNEHNLSDITGSISYAGRGHRFIDHRVLQAVVSRSRDFDEASFLGYASRTAAVNFHSFIYLRSPANGGVSLYVTSLNVSRTTAGAVYIGRDILQAASATDGVENSVNFGAGADASVGQITTAEINTISTPIVPAEHLTLREVQVLTANERVPVRFDQALEIPPGAGLFVFSPTHSIGLYADFQWYEKLSS